MGLLLLLLSLTAQAANRFQIDVPATLGKTLAGKSYVIYTHPSAGFDSGRKSEAGVGRLNAWAKKKGLPQVLLFTGDLNNSHFYLGSSDIDLTVASGAGQHKLIFPAAREFVMAGGSFSLCLCESIRDIVKGTGTAPVRIRLVTDAIYERSELLESLRKGVTADRFLALAAEKLIQDGVLCPKQGVRLSLKGLEIRLLTEKASLSLGKGPKKVTLEFLRSSDLN